MGWRPGGSVMLSLLRARGDMRWLSLASPSGRLPQDVWSKLASPYKENKARTIRKVHKAQSLIRPWKYPNMIETGRNIRSDGSRMNKARSLTTLVISRNANWAMVPYQPYPGIEVSTNLYVKNTMRGSITNARDVKVATCSAYVDQGCCLQWC